MHSTHSESSFYLFTSITKGHTMTYVCHETLNGRPIFNRPLFDRTTNIMYDTIPTTRYLGCRPHHPSSQLSNQENHNYKRYVSSIVYVRNVIVLKGSMLTSTKTQPYLIFQIKTLKTTIIFIPKSKTKSTS